MKKNNLCVILIVVACLFSVSLGFNIYQWYDNQHLRQVNSDWSASYQLEIQRLNNMIFELQHK